MSEGVVWDEPLSITLDPVQESYVNDLENLIVYS